MSSRDSNRLSRILTAPSVWACHGGAHPDALQVKCVEGSPQRVSWKAPNGERVDDWKKF